MSVGMSLSNLRSRIGLAVIMAVSNVLLVSLEITCVSSFIQPSLPNSMKKPVVGRIIETPSTFPLGMTSKPSDGNSEITKQLERAKAALAVSRAKMEAQQQADANLVAEEKKEENNVPFFAMSTVDENEKKKKVIKDKNADGLFTTDGDLMAKLSEEEEWESRPLLEVFENERESTPDAMNIDRDIGQSMYNLRKSLQTEDFSKIFDKRNRFIGEV